MELSSLHSYLEACFANESVVTNNMIQRAKQDYRKLYLSEYHASYREEKIQVSFRIPKEKYLQLTKQAKEKGMKLSTFMRNRALKERSSQIDQSHLKEKILTLMDEIEEAEFEAKPIQSIPIIESLEEILKQLP